MLREKLEPELGVTNYPRKAKKAASRSESTLVLLLSRFQARMPHFIVGNKFKFAVLLLRILLSPSKNNKKNLDSYCFVTSF
jgi:hypothetical protein